MRLITIVGLLALGLAGCQTTGGNIIVHKNVAIDVPAQLFKCTGVRYPNPRTLTDVQVAELIVSLAGANEECRRNMGAIRSYLTQAKKQVNR